MNKIIIIVVATVLAVDIYVEMALLGSYPYYWHLLWWIPAVAAIVGLLVSKLWHIVCGRYFAKGALLAVEIPKVPFVACSAIGTMLSPVIPGVSLFWNGLGVLMGLSLSVAMLYGMLWGWKRLRVVEVTLEFESLPAEFDGYRIVQLSDLHLGSLDKDSSFMKDVIQKANALGGDAIVFTGDLVNFSAEEAKPFLPLLSTLRAPDGVFAVLGNHDYPKGGSKEHIQAEGIRLAEAERRMGWHVLLNESYTLRRDRARLVFAGLDDVSGKRLTDVDSLKAVIKNIPTGDFPVLLSHRPNIWSKAVVEIAVPLTLSGHTHAGQIRLGNWSPAKADCTEWCGVYRQGSQVLYVSQGTGTKFRFRLGTYAEITLITLHRK
jgi:hypothetical protein